MKLRISKRVLEHLKGSQAWYTPDDRERVEADTGALFHRFIDAVDAGNRKDGSVTLDFDRAEMWILHLYVSVMAQGAADNVGNPRDPYYDGDALADLNSARALCRKIEAEGIAS